MVIRIKLKIKLISFQNPLCQLNETVCVWGRRKLTYDQHKRVLSGVSALFAFVFLYGCICAMTACCSTAAESRKRLLFYIQLCENDQRWRKFEITLFVPSEHYIVFCTTTTTFTIPLFSIQACSNNYFKNKTLWSDSRLLYNRKIEFLWVPVPSNSK